jgi:preprotein translocase subunit YajC
MGAIPVHSLTEPTHICGVVALSVGLAVAGQSAIVSKLVLRMLANVTCNGVPSFSFFNCVDDGVMCSNHGNCSSSGVCQCGDQWEGQYCQTLKSDSSSSDTLGIILGATLGAILPVVCLVLVFLVGVIFALVVRLERKRREKGDWEIDAEELEIGDQLGAGGYGTVYRAKWRGTEVAVKMMPGEQVTREMERNFKEEVPVPIRQSMPLRFISKLCRNDYYNRQIAGAGDDGVAAPQRGAVHGGLD